MTDERHDRRPQVNRLRWHVALLAILVVLVLLVTACGNGSDAEGGGDDSYNLRIGFVNSGDSLGSELIKEFAKHAEAESDGRITVQPFYEGAVGGESEMMGQIADGSLDMGLIGSGVVSTIAPKSNITELPYLWESEDELYDIVFDGPISDEVAAQLEEEGIKLLGWGDWGPRDIFSAGAPVESIDDLEGLQIRVVENPLYLETLRTWGAVPTPIPFPETYSALQQGVVNAVDTNSHGFVDASLYEVTDYVSPTAHIHTALAFIINQESWEALPDDIQQILVEATEAGMAENRERAAGNREMMFERMEEEGMEIVDIDTMPLEESAVDIQDQFAEEAGFTDLLERARELKAER